MLQTSQISSTNTATNAAAILAYSASSLPNGKPTALLVEDDNYVSAAMWTLLNDANFDVAIATSGAEGFELARSLSPDIVVLDVNLPEMNGLEICRRLKADQATSGMPIVFFSAQNHLAEQALALGAEAFLVKPLDIVRLPDCLTQILAARASARMLQSQAPIAGR